MNASSVPKSEHRKLSHPVPFAAYRHSHGKQPWHGHIVRHAPADDQSDLRQQCEQHAAAAKTQSGWIKSRFESCQKRPYDLILRDKSGTEAIGRLWFDMWTLGFTYDGSRRVDYLASVENIRVQTAGLRGQDRPWGEGTPAPAGRQRQAEGKPQEVHRGVQDSVGRLLRVGLGARRVPVRQYKEGSTKGDNRYSVRLITGADNNAGGNMLLAVYSANRVLDGDAFYVKITD
ncbi:hypothetical protein ACWEPI_19785 [Streptomyces sp. NPDC004262]